MTSIITSSCAHVAGHVTFWYKRGHTQWGDGSVTRDFREVGPLKAHAGSNASSAPEKPRSATHSSTITTSTGLLCLSVGALVHCIYGRSCE